MSIRKGNQTVAGIGGTYMPTRTIIQKTFNYSYTQTIGTTSTPVQFSDGTTSISFVSHGGGLKISGGIFVQQNSGGNHYFYLVIDNGTPYTIETGTSTANVFESLAYYVPTLSAGTHTIALTCNTNTYTATLSQNTWTNIIFEEVF